MKQLRPIRTMMYCWFCGGRVVALSGDAVAGRGRNITGYRCEAEGVRWDATDNLVLYSRRAGEELTQVRTLKDPMTGKFIASDAIGGPA